jgi:hypothetical protein
MRTLCQTCKLDSGLAQTRCPPFRNRVLVRQEEADPHIARTPLMRLIFQSVVSGTK